MFTNRHYKYLITSFFIPILIGGILLHPAIITVSHAAFTTTITSDGTMGSTVTQSGKVYNIDGGTIRRTNQFQSFGLFSVGTGDTASFNGPSGIANILSRVTGGQQSMIDGILKSTISGANLYMLNPSGVLFGPNARLDVTGSFHASTADFLRLGDNGIFYANPLKGSVLTSAPPTAFGFLGDHPAGISIQGSVLQVPYGKMLSVVGGDIDIAGGSLSTPSGQINLVGVSSPGEVNLNDFSTNSFAKLGDITVSQNSSLYVWGTNYTVDPGGTIIIRGGQLFIKDGDINARGNPGGSLNFSGERLQLDNTFLNTGTRGAVNHPGTGVDISVTGEMLLTNGSEIASSSFGTGRAGDVRITARSIQLGDDDPTKSLYGSTGFYGDIGSRAYGAGRSGNVYITADHLTVENGFFINTATLSSGDAGNVIVHANSLNLLDGGSISSNGQGTGSGGTVDIVATDAVLSGTNTSHLPLGINFSGFTGLAAQAQYGSKGGLLRLTADSLQILDGAKISTTLYGTGPGADIVVTAKNMLISGVFVDSRLDPPDSHASITARVVRPLASGTGGNIYVTADSLRVTDGGLISSGLFLSAPGNAGNITVRTGSLEVSDRGAIQASSVDGTGNAGRLDITAKDVRIIGVKSSLDPFGKDFTGFSTSTNAGRGGDLSVTADSLTVTEKGTISSASLGTGPGGNINIGVNNIWLSYGAVISAEGSRAGNAGNIDITATDSLLMRNSSITTEAKQADGGNIHVHAGYMVELIDSKITASVGGGPETVGGNITIDPQYVILNDSQIIANAYEGKGGNIRIIADVFLASPDSIVDASSALGIDGTVDIRAPITNISGTLAPMQGNFLSTEALLRDRCIARIRGERISSFVVSGRDGLPIRPGNVLPSPIY